MELPVFARGLIIGFSIAAPVGRIGLLCIRRTLADGRVTGLAVGLVAVVADAMNRLSGLVLLIFGVTALLWR